MVIEEDVVIFVGPQVLVSSKSRHGDYHSVQDGRCSCLGFEHYGRCRHLGLAAQAQERDRLSALPLCVAPGCQRPAKVGPRCCIHHGQWAMGEGN